MSSDLKEELKKHRAKITPPKREIDFQVDTIPERTDAAAYFSPRINTITENYVKGKDNSYSQSRSALAHEQKHRDNHNAIDEKTIPMSLEQYYKICCYDEISANTCELLQLRQEYLVAKTEADKQKIMKDNPRFDYYFNAVKNGTINPESRTSAEFDKEMRFIAVETQKMWMDRYAQRYDINHISMTKDYFDHKDFKDLAPNDANYNKVRQTYMTCGGIDFSKYLEDIPCINENIKEADRLLRKKASLTGRSDILGQRITTTTTASRFEIKKHITPQNFTTTPQMSLEEYAKLQIHQLIAKDMQYTLEARKKYLSAKTETERQNIIEEYSLYSYDYQIKNNKFKPGTPASPTKEELKWIYQDSSNPYSTYMSNNEQITDLQSFCQEHQDNLKSNPKNYQAELKKIYTINGMDYSSYADVDIVIPNLYIKNASKKVAANKPVNAQDIRDYKVDCDIVVPQTFRTEGLSPTQQFELARKQMFMENLLASNPLMQEKKFNTITGHEEYINGAIKSYIENLKESPELKKNWNKAEQQLAEQIMALNQNTVILDKASDKEFKKAMDALNILPCGIDMQKYTKTNINATLNLIPIPPQIKKVENSTWYERLGNKTITAYKETKELASATWNKTKECVSSALDWLSDECLPLRKYTSYQGAPQYPEWSKDKRVSPVQKETIYDLSSNYLLAQRNQLDKDDKGTLKKEMSLDSKKHEIIYETYGKRKKGKEKVENTTSKTPRKRITQPANTQIAPADNISSKKVLFNPLVRQKTK